MNLDQAAKKLSKAILDASVGQIESVPKGWFTLGQLSSKLGKHENSIRDQINGLVKSGSWERKKFRIQCAERILPVSHYKPK